MLFRLLFVVSVVALPMQALAHEGVEGVPYVVHLITHIHHILPAMFIVLGVVLVYAAIHPLMKSLFVRKRKEDPASE